jgi:hypothetical protein
MALRLLSVRNAWPLSTRRLANRLQRGEEKLQTMFANASPP